MLFSSPRSYRVKKSIRKVPCSYVLRGGFIVTAVGGGGGVGGWGGGSRVIVARVIVARVIVATVIFITIVIFADLICPPTVVESPHPRDGEANQSKVRTRVLFTYLINYLDYKGIPHTSHAICIGARRVVVLKSDTNFLLGAGGAYFCNCVWAY